MATQREKLEEEDKRVFLTFEEAEALLPEGERIHTFRNAPGVFVGADWDRAAVLKVLRAGKPELTGPMATSMGHGMVVIDAHGPLFIATKKKEK